MTHEFVSQAKAAFKKFHEHLEQVADVCPGHRSIQMLLACVRCAGKLHSQLDKRRQLDREQPVTYYVDATAAPLKDLQYTLVTVEKGVK